MSAAQTERDFVVVGGGIIGLAVARELSIRWPERALAVLEREAQVGTGQTGANSGVIHAGIYYKPGSLKARLCVTGARELYSYCEQHSIPHERCGKLIVARHEGELGRLDELERRGRENGVSGLRRLNADELKAVEPHARGVAALDSPSTGIVDFAAVARSLAAGLRSRDSDVVTGCAVETVRVEGDRVVLGHSRGQTRCRLRRLLRGRGGRSPGGGGGRLSRSPDRALQGQLSVPPSRALPSRQVTHLSRA